MRGSVLLLLLFGLNQWAFAQSKNDSLILGKWQLYPNVNVAEVMKFVRPESLGDMLEDLNPSSYWWFVKQRNALIRHSHWSALQTENGLISKEEANDNLSMSQDDRGEWSLVENGATIRVHMEQDWKTMHYQIIRLDSENLWLRKQ